jgi:hypothetical protein
VVELALLWDGKLTRPVAKTPFVKHNDRNGLRSDSTRAKRSNFPSGFEREIRRYHPKTR